MATGKLKTILNAIKRQLTYILVWTILLIPGGGVLFATPDGYVSISTNKIFNYKKDLTITSFYLIKPSFKVGNISFQIPPHAHIYKVHLFGDTLVVYSSITDEIKVFLYDTTCTKKILTESIPLLKDVVVKEDNELVAITEIGEKPLDIYTSQKEDILSPPTIDATPTIDNLYIEDGKLLAITDKTATFTYNGISLHLGDDIYPSGNNIWLTRDHITYKTDNLSFKTSDPIWFIEDHPITATNSGIFGPILKIYTYENEKWKKKTYHLILSDISAAIKGKKAKNISLGSTSNSNLFMALTGSTSTLFVKYTVTASPLKISYESTKDFPDTFIIRGKYAISPRTGYIMKVGSWGSPLPPSPHVSDLLIKIPFFITDRYLDSLHIRWCRER